MKWLIHGAAVLVLALAGVPADAQQERTARQQGPAQRAAQDELGNMQCTCVPEPGDESRLSCACTPAAEWSTTQDTMVLGRQAQGVPTPEVDETRAEYPDTSDALTRAQGVEEGERWRGEPEDIGRGDPAVRGAEAAGPRRGQGRAGVTGRTGEQGTETFRLTCYPEDPTKISREPAGAEPGKGPETGAAGETRLTCIRVPEGDWSTVQDTMVLGRQSTGVPTPPVDKGEADYPDTSDTITRRQGTEQGQRWRGEPEDIGENIETEGRPGEQPARSDTGRQRDAGEQEAPSPY